jgi:N-terminal region of glycosyl transferase group 7
MNIVGWTNITSEMEEALLKEDQVKVESKMKEAGLEIGGRYEPSECRSRHKVAIVVPYRDREDHLTVFLRYLHPFLMRQQLNYVVIIVEQSGMYMRSKCVQRFRKKFLFRALRKNFKCEQRVRLSIEEC